MGYEAILFDMDGVIVVPDFTSIGLLAHKEDAKTARDLRIGAEHSLPSSSSQ